MKIHTAKAKEGIYDIAREYGTSEDMIRRDNEISSGMPATYEELLIRIPSRTYKARYGDTVDRLAMRFQVDEDDIVALNPYISEHGLQPGDLVALRQCERKYGNAVSNGYFYRGCTKKLLSRALPYLTYVTVAAAILSENTAHMTFDTKEIVVAVSNAQRTPLLRLHLQGEKLTPNALNCIIEAVETNGFSGAVLPMQARGEEYKNLLKEIREKFAERNLYFIIEADEGTSPLLTSEADACFLSYYKFALDNPQSFDEGERNVYKKFTSNTASSNILIDLPSMARCGDEFIKAADALNIARKARAEMQTDDSLLMHFESRRERYSFTALKNIKATLDLIAEYGFMGVSFDIMRSPLSHLLMYNELFKTVTNTTVNSREGCSRE